MNILAIPGSLRAHSSTMQVLAVIQSLMPADVHFSIYRGVGTLPHFDGTENPSAEVLDLRRQIQEADAVLVCTPEYAFGVPGSLKNALDWTVGTGELVNKRLGLITASTGGEYAHAALLNTFRALSADIREGGALLISFIRAKLGGDGNIKDADTLEGIKKVIESLIDKRVNG